MSDLLLARGQMAMSLAFHIVFAAIGIAMPLCMVIAEIIGRTTGDEVYLSLAKRWAKGAAVLFAVGAVSGTVLSFELGLLFPGFMRHAGALVGIPFSLEGFAFFTEAIFLGIYLYGWERVRWQTHVLAGVIVALSGLLSAVFVTFVNAWMNTPVGYRMQGDSLLAIDPIGALRAPFAAHEIPHMVLACYLSTTLAVAAIHAIGLLRDPQSPFHLRALKIALGVAIPTALAQPLVGHFAGQQTARYQPMKLAAMEQQMQTQANAPLRLGPIAIPGGLSFMATGDVHGVVQGLEEAPPEDRPPSIIRPAFQLMVGLGSLFVLYSLWAIKRWFQGRLARGRAFLWATVALGPLGFLAMEAGWTVTEVGRQPWVIYNVLRTSQAVTPTHGLPARMVLFALVYLLLGATVVVVISRHVRATLEPR